VARGRYLGFKQPDENEPWTIHIAIRVPSEEDESAPEAEPVDGDEPPDDDS
jgi:hypothetical protein